MLVSAAWIVPAGFAAINRLAQAFFSNSENVTAQDLIWASGDWFLYAFLTPFVFLLSRRYPLVFPNLRNRVIFHLAVSLLFCVAWATFGKLLEVVLIICFEPQTARNALQSADFFRQAGINWLSWIFTTFPFGIAVYLCVVGIEHAFRYFIEAQQNEVQVAKLSGQLADARFATLQAQVNPHFLFNTLNTIAVFVRENKSESAVFIVEQLSELLRTTLGSHQSNEVILGEELELIRRYLSIEEARFSDRLRYKFEVDNQLLFALLPGFALQHLVENAVRHGIARKTDSGNLLISARRDGEVVELSVTDDGIGLEAGFVFPVGHGLSNTMERLRLLYGEKASLALVGSGETTVATLRIPYHEDKLEAKNEPK